MVFWQNKHGAKFHAGPFYTYEDAEAYADGRHRSGKCVGLHIDPPLPRPVQEIVAVEQQPVDYPAEPVVASQHKSDKFLAFVRRLVGKT